jgi:hypothetical protein
MEKHYTPGGQGFVDEFHAVIIMGALQEGTLLKIAFKDFTPTVHIQSHLSRLTGGYFIFGLGKR